MTPVYLLECALYSTVNFLPCMLLALYPFRRELRFSLPLTALGIVCNCAIHMVMNTLKLTTNYDGLLSMGCSLIHILFMFSMVKAHWGKSLFTLLMMTNTSNFIIVSSKCLEGLLFPNIPLDHFHWTNSLTMVIMDFVVLTPLFVYFQKIYSKAMEQESSPTVWRYLWLIPLTFYSVWFRNFYFSQEGALTLALRPRYTLFSLVINGGALLVYALIAQLINEHAENQRLKERESQLLLQQEQYTNLQDRIEEARRAKHDLRQHMHVISAFVKEQRFEELDTYIQRYHRTLPEENTLQYCQNFAVNALLQYFAGYAKMISAGYSAHMELPKEVGIPDEILTVVLGNLTENAVEACVAQGSGSLVSIWGKADDSAVFFKIVNTCPQPPRQDSHGRYYSSKRKKGYGIGLRSVENITKQYDGIMKTAWEDGKFIVSVMLNIPA